MLEQWKTFLLPSYLVSQQLHTQRIPSASWKTILSASMMFSWDVTLLVTVSGRLKIASQIYLCPNPQALNMLLYVAKVTSWVWLSKGSWDTGDFPGLAKRALNVITSVLMGHWRIWWSHSSARRYTANLKDGKKDHKLRSAALGARKKQGTILP